MELWFSKSTCRDRPTGIGDLLKDTLGSNIIIDRGAKRRIFPACVPIQGSMSEIHSTNLGVTHC
jgi:hypothetical protein